MNNAMKNIADLYPLSPMQQGMLFHSLAEPESGVYVELLSCALKGRLDVEAFTHAWQRVMQRHPVLRTAMLVSEVKEPVQVVYRSVSLPIHVEDWRGLPAAEQQRRLETFHQEEQARGFQLSTPPLMRLALLRLGDDAWQFVWTYHHVLLDGWSTPIVFQEVMAFYQAFACGQDLHLELPAAYRDYIVWLRRQDMGRAEAYWRKALAGFTAPTPLAVPHPAPEFDPELPAYAERELWLPEAQVQKLQAFARQHNLTLNSLVSGAWAVLLARYSGEEEVCFGATVSGRPPELPGSESMVGLFINTLPVRVHVDPRMPVSAWLRQFQAQMVEMRQYEYSPLVDIHRWSGAPAGQPLFESILVYENFPIQKLMSGEAAPAELEIERMHSVEQTNFPLTAVAGAAGDLMLKLVYDTSMFTAEWIDRMLGHWSNLITAAAAQPETPPVSLPLLSPAERRQVLVEFNNHRAGFPADRCVHDLVAAQAARFPTAPAIDFEGEILSYGELDARANRLAHYLQSQGIGHGSLVGLCFQRSPEMIIGMLGVLKSGAAYVPLDPAYPADRLAFMIEDSAVQVVLSTAALRDNIPGEGRRVIALDEAREAIEAQPAGAPAHQAGPDSLAYVIYTSGSTGKPKGVLLKHRGLCNLVTQYARAIDLGLGMRMLQFFSYSFDGSVADIFVALTSGAALCMARAENLLPGPELVRFIRERGVTHGMITPSALAALPVTPLPSLRVLLTGGEACSRVTVEPWLRGRRVINAYGPTENTVISTLYEITDLDGEPEVLPIGQPLTNTTVYILDPQLNPVPAGIAGEVYVGGPGIAAGYLNRPELTAERFLPDPFIAELGAGEPAPRMYRTGDVGRWRSDGSGVVEYLGRTDDQVKVRGFRIELGEIEAALCRHERVAAAVMAAVPESGGEPGMVRLAAYVVSKEGEEPLSLEEARAFLRKTLPEYMLPAVLVPMQSLPLTPSGKINRKALPLPDGSAAGLVVENVPPRNELEAGLCAIWEGVLNRRPVGVKDNFFDLGGHSLLAVRVVAQVKEKLGVELPLVTLFQHPTVEQLAVAIQKQSSADETAMLTEDFTLAGEAASSEGAEGDGEEASSIVPLRQGGSKPPLFFVHPSGGSTHWYTELSEALGGDQPFYGIQARGVMGDRPIHTSITEMAAYYVRALRQAQQQGPYYLGSWSLGVIIVYEMAQQLAAAGEQVALLAMLDQGPEMPLPKTEDDADYLVQTFGKNLKLDANELRRLSYRDMVAHVLEKGKRARWIFPDITLDAFFHFVNILRTHGDAWRAYQAQPYPGKVTLFRAKGQEIPAHLGPDLGWGSVARGGVEVIEVPGNHLTMIHKPHVKALAKKLREAIDAAEAQSFARGEANHDHQPIQTV